MVLILTTLFKAKAQKERKVKHQKTHIRDNGKTILNMVLVNKPIVVSVPITDIGKMVKGTEKV